MELPTPAPSGPEQFWGTELAATASGPPVGLDGAAPGYADAAGPGSAALFALPMLLAAACGALPLLLTHSDRAARTAGALAAGFALCAAISSLADSRSAGPAAVLLYVAGAGALHAARAPLSQLCRSAACGDDSDERSALLLLAAFVSGAGDAIAVGLAVAAGTGQTAAAAATVRSTAEGLALCSLLAYVCGVPPLRAATGVVAAKAAQPAIAALACAFPQPAAVVARPLVAAFAAGGVSYFVLSEAVPALQKCGADHRAAAAVAVTGAAACEMLRYSLDWVQAHAVSSVPVFTALAWSTAAGLSTGVGALAIVAVDSIGDRMNAAMLGFAAGVMLSLSAFDLFLPNVAAHGVRVAALSLLAGGLVVAVLDKLIAVLGLQEHLLPASPSRKPQSDEPDGRRLGHSAVLTVLALAAHNAPEGLAVGLTSMAHERSRTALVAVAIAMHNVPEGLAVAVAVLRATGNRARAVVVATCTGLVEPVAAVVSVAAVSHWVTAEVLQVINMGVAGVMATVSVKELLPQALCMSPTLACAGALVGFVVMGVSVGLLEPEQLTRVSGAVGALSRAVTDP